MTKFRKWLYSDESAKIKLTIVATAMQCDRNPAENRKRISKTVREITEKYPDTELVMFGEMILGWYDPLGMTEYHHQISETIPGETTGLVCDLARANRIFISCGLSEKTTKGLHNAQILVNPQGEIQTVHRKWNLKPAERRAGYLPGSHPVTTTEINGVRTGIIICSDAAHPKTMRTLIKSKLELILYSLADDKDEKWFAAKANARMYDAWIVSSNRFGMENNYWNGHTVISDPLGNLRKMLIDKQGYLVQTLQFAQDRSVYQRILRGLFVKAPLLVHLVKNWRILKSYYQ